MSAAGLQVGPFQWKSAVELLWIAFPFMVMLIEPLEVMWVMPSKTTLKSPVMCAALELQSTE